MGSGASANNNSNNAWLSQAAPEKQTPTLRCEVCGRSLAKRSYKTAANGDVLCIACWDEQPRSPQHQRRMSGKRMSTVSLRSGGATSAWQLQGYDLFEPEQTSQAGNRNADKAWGSASQPLRGTRVDRSAASRATASQPLPAVQRGDRNRSVGTMQQPSAAWAAAPDSRLTPTRSASTARRSRPVSKTPSVTSDSGDCGPCSQSLSRAGSQSQLSMRSNTRQSTSDISTASRSTSAGGVASWTLPAERNCACDDDGLNKSASLGRPLRPPLTGFETKTWPVDKFNPTTSMPPATRTAQKESDAQLLESDQESFDSLSDVSSSHRRHSQDQASAPLPPVTTAAGTRSRRSMQNRKHEVKKFQNGNTILLNHPERKRECLLWE